MPTCSPISSTSQLKIAGTIHEQERDAAKFWHNGEIRIALWGLENQTEPDADMPLRVIAYDGASYKEQVNLHISQGRERKPRSPVYPAITLILYFGDKHWDAPKSLMEYFTKIDPALAPYVQDYKIHVFEIAFLAPEQLARFHSDFRFVADFLVQKRTKKEYDPPNEVVRHVDEVLKLLSAITGDQRYVEVKDQLNQMEMREATMCSIFDSAIEKGRVEGRAEGRVEGRAEGRAENEQAMLHIIQAIQRGESDSQIFQACPNASKEIVRALRNAISLPS